MKKFKLLLIFALLFFITGCDVVYELGYDGENFFETTSFDVLKSTLNGESIMDYSDRWICENYSCTQGIFVTYAKKTKEFENHENIKSSLRHSPATLSNSLIAWTCFDYINVEEKETSISLLATNGKKCFDYYDELDSITINFKSLYQVINNNANSYENNNYQWVLNRENAEGTEIILEITKEKDYNIKQYLYFTVGVISILFAIGLIYVAIKIIKARGK